MSYFPEKTRQKKLLAGWGVKAENYPVACAPNSTIFVTQSVYYAAIGLFKGDVIANVAYAVATASASSTSLFGGIYDSAFQRVAVSSDLTTTKDAATGIILIPVSYTVPSDGLYYIAILSVATTPPVVSRGGSAGGLYAGVGAGVRIFGVQTGQTTLPTTATIGGSSNFAIWVGVT